MVEQIKRNFVDASIDVLSSISGTIGIFFIISYIISSQDDTGFWVFFMRYFEGGQLGLSILSLSGIMFIAIKRHGPLSPIWSFVLYIIFVVPVIAVSVIVGLNPGFESKGLSHGNLEALWVIYFGLHFVWLVVLLLRPDVPNPQEAGQAQDDRVRSIKEKARGREY